MVTSEGSRFRSSWISAQYRFPSRYRIVWIALAALVLLSIVSAPNVVGRDSLSVVSALAGVLAIASFGQLLVIAHGGIDLSVPAIMAIGAAIVVKQADQIGTPMLIVVACVACGVAGLVNAALIAVFRLNAVIATLATSTGFAGVLLLWTGNSFSRSGEVPRGLGSIARDHVGPISYICLVAVMLAAVLSLVLRRTVIGRNFLVIGANAYAARVIGIKVLPYQVAAYVLAGMLYGLAGALLAGYLGRPNASIGLSYQLTVIVVVALSGAAFTGGSGSPAGIVAGSFFVVLLRQYLAAKGMSAGVQVLVDGAALIAAVAIVSFSSGRQRWRGRRRRPDETTAREPVLSET